MKFYNTLIPDELRNGIVKSNGVADISPFGL